ncbi:hypothetical protein M3Y97_00842200 [Aphelenchoides bicaudatus]|nr:hypothetical protein M3Y97_00842200 [Aphelenchoides bicaudatus]
MRLQDSLKLLCFYALVVVYAKEEIKDLSHGFGTDIEWIEFDKAEELSNELKKPVFVLIHKTWCGACKQLKNSFSSSPKRKEFIQLTRRFVMVNLEDDEEPQDDKFAPDGAYIPRLYFLKGSDVLPVTNKNYPKNLYYFPQLPDVMKAMNQALKLYGEESKTAESNDEKTEKVEKTEKKEKANDETKDSKNEKAEKKETKTDSKNEKAEKKETKTDKKDSKKEDKKTDKKKEDSKKADKKKEDSKKEDKKTDKKKEEKADKKKEDSKKEDKKKETKTDKKDSKKEDKKKDADGECPHAKKAREEKEKKASKSDSKSGKDEKKAKEPKSNTKKSEL